MSITGTDINETIGHVATAEAFKARMEQIKNEGNAPEMCNNAMVASGFPPDMCATAHPQEFRVGSAYPDLDKLPDNHPVSITLKGTDGIYTSHELMSALKDALGPATPSLNLNSAFSANAGKGYEEPSQGQFDIALETAKGPTFG